MRYFLGTLILCAMIIIVGSLASVIVRVNTLPAPVLPPDYCLIRNGKGEYRWMKSDNSQTGVTLFKYRESAIQAAIDHMREANAAVWTVVETGVNTNR